MIRYLLTLALVLLAAPCFAVLTRTYTVCESGCDYTSVQAAETAIEQDLVANDSAITFEIQNTWASPDGGTLVDGWVTDATRFLTITAIGAARAGATSSATAYRAESSGFAFEVRENFTVLDGVQGTATAASGRAYTTATNGGDVTIKNCFFSGSSQTSSRGIVLNVGGVSGIIIRNNVVIDCALEGIFGATGSTGGCKVDNNTIENCLDGIETSTEFVIARNNILWNCTNPLVGDFNTTTLSEENYTDAGSLSYGSCGSCGTGDQVSQSDPFVNLAGENYHLASGATAIDAGKDLSGDFTDAIGGKTRDANFDKGADEFISSGPTKIYKKVKLQKVKI